MLQVIWLLLLLGKVKSNSQKTIKKYIIELFFFVLQLFVHMVYSVYTVNSEQLSIIYWS